ncbi:MAG: dipeptidase D [Saprospiraceae bacterium]|jgi:dipeptidase D
MSTTIKTLNPKALWKNFANLNAVPRPSKKEKRVIAFAKNFGESLGLKTFVDEVGNVIIRKPASKGMENRIPIVMQSHLDMVHQKNADTSFDFDKQGIEMYIDDDWVKAKGTTLGADNGIGVATIMAVLESKTIKHPPLEALFTIDEETGMTGAMGLKGGLLEGKIMLNLDTEDDRELSIGCAGGVDITATGKYKEVKTSGKFQGIQLKIKGLNGGHSGMDIHKGFGNANKIMNRILFAASSFGIRLSKIDGGGLRNAIPRESFSIIAVPEKNVRPFKKYIKELTATLATEHLITDPNLEIEVKAVSSPTMVMAKDFQEMLLRSVYACPNGIYRMSPDIKDLVQTSNNLARVLVENGKYQLLCLTRSSVDSEKTDLAQAITSTFELMGAKVKTSGNYPGWTPRPDAAIVKIMSTLYKKMFQEEPDVNACHAGLECGILGTFYPEMEMISFGPNIRGAHSPDEKVQISSVQKFWDYLLAALKQIPKDK